MGERNRLGPRRGTGGVQQQRHVLRPRGVRQVQPVAVRRRRRAGRARGGAQQHLAVRGVDVRKGHPHPQRGRRRLRRRKVGYNYDAQNRCRSSFCLVDLPAIPDPSVWPLLRQRSLRCAGPRSRPALPLSLRPASLPRSRGEPPMPGWTGGPGRTAPGPRRASPPNYFHARSKNLPPQASGLRRAAQAAWSSSP